MLRRARVRQQLSRATPRLRQLAALDGVTAQLLDVREQRLLATVPGWLERRFEQLRTAHTPANEAANEAANVDSQAQPPWLATFEREWQAVALAELEQRLLPVLGMVEAMNNEATTCR